MNGVLWIVQVLLAMLFLIHGIMMVNPPAQVHPMMGNIYNLQPAFRRFIGVAEILAAIGLILPGLTHILPVLTPLAAAGLVVIMVSAAIYHLARREYSNVALNLALLALAAFVAYGHFALVPL